MSKRQKILTKLTMLFGILTLLLIPIYLVISLNNTDIVVRVLLAILMFSSFVSFVIFKTIPREKLKKIKVNKNIEKGEEVELMNEVEDNEKMNKKLTIYRIISIILFAAFLISLGFNIFGKKNEVNLNNLEMNVVASHFTEPKEEDIIKEIRYEMTIGIYNKNSYDISLFAEKFDLYFYNINANSIFEEINFPIYFTFSNMKSEIKIKPNKYTEVKIISQSFTETAGSVIIGMKAISLMYDDKLIFVAGGF